MRPPDAPPTNMPDDDQAMVKIGIFSHPQLRHFLEHGVIIPYATPVNREKMDKYCREQGRAGARTGTSPWVAVCDTFQVWAREQKK